MKHFVFWTCLLGVPVAGIPSASAQEISADSAAPTVTTPLPVVTPLRAPGVSPIVVAPAAGRDTTVVLYQGAPPDVRDVRQVQLGAGRSLVAVESLLGGKDALGDSLRVGFEPTARLVGTYKSPSVGEERGLSLREFVGQKLTLLRSKGAAGEETTTGTLLSVDPPLLDTGNGVLLNPPGVWLLPREAVGRTAGHPAVGAGLEVETPVAGRYRVELLYSTPSLTATWNAFHTVQVLPSGDRVRFSTAIRFENAAFLRVGRVTRVVLVGREGRYELAGDALVYETATLFDGELPVVRSVVLDRAGEFLSSFRDVHPNVALTTGPIPRDLPGGKLTLWTRRRDDPTLPTSTTIAGFGPFSATGTLSVPLQSATNLALDRAIVSNKLLNPTTREIVVSWKVRASSNAEAVTILDTAPPSYRLIDATLKPAEIDGRELRFVVSPTVGEETEFRYTVQIPA